MAGKRYFPVLVYAHNYLDEFDVDTTDILLAMITELAALLKEETGIVLGDNYFSDRLQELKSLLFSRARKGTPTLVEAGRSRKVGVPNAAFLVSRRQRFGVAALLLIQFLGLVHAPTGACNIQDDGVMDQAIHHGDRDHRVAQVVAL